MGCAALGSCLPWASHPTNPSRALVTRCCSRVSWKERSSLGGAGKRKTVSQPTWEMTGLQPNWASGLRTVTVGSSYRRSHPRNPLRSCARRVNQDHRCPRSRTPLLSTQTQEDRSEGRGKPPLILTPSGCWKHTQDPS